VTTIAGYHQAVKARLLADPLIHRFEIRRERKTLDDGHLRARLTLFNGDQLEFSEYVRQVQGIIEVITYSFHWTDPDGKLIRRWDNAPHFPHLPQAPHHIHESDEETVVPGRPITITQVLDEISASLS
jgi:hypothetical protein